MIHTGKNTTITSVGLDNTNGLIRAGQNLSINTQYQDLINKSDKKSEGIFGQSIQINTDGILQNRGAIKGDSIRLIANTLFQQNGYIDATGDIAIHATGDLINHTGRIRSDKGAIK